MCSGICLPVPIWASFRPRMIDENLQLISRSEVRSLTGLALSDWKQIMLKRKVMLTGIVVSPVERAYPFQASNSRAFFERKLVDRRHLRLLLLPLEPIETPKLNNCMSYPATVYPSTTQHSTAQRTVLNLSAKSGFKQREAPPFTRSQPVLVVLAIVPISRRRRNLCGKILSSEIVLIRW